MPMVREANETKQGISPKRKRLFAFMLMLFPLVILLLLELSLRLADYGDSYNLFEDCNLYGKEYRRCHQDFGKKYFNHVVYTTPVHEMFLKKKPENGFRIFVIGSSTAVGFPYGSGVMFPRILQERLRDSYPGRTIEVINTAMTAINSYTFRDKIGEILAEEPDAILIYGGQNEFYGALGIGSREALGSIRWIKVLHLQLLEFKTYQLLRNMISGISHLGRGENKAAVADASTTTLMEVIVADKDIAYKSRLYDLALEHYRKNMKAILKKARKKGVPVFFSELVSNVRDLPPLGSSGAGKVPSALSVYEEAVAFEREGEYEKARKSYYLAKDLDCIRFRAPSEMNAIVHALSAEYGAVMIPMNVLFEENSPHGLIGGNLITEHVHPNMDGYFLMADAFFGAIIRSAVMGKPDSGLIRPSAWYRANWAFTAIDSMRADILLKKLKAGWPFKPDTIINTFLEDYRPQDIVDSLAYQSVRYAGINLVSAHKKMAQYYLARGNSDKAYREYAAILKIEPYDLQHYTEAGDLLFKAGNIEKAMKIYRASLTFHRDIYVVSRMGEILVAAGEYEKAIPLLEEVGKADPEFRQQVVLKLLYRALIETGDTGRAGALLSRHRKLLSDRDAGEGKREVVLRIPAEVKPIIDQATRHLRANEVDKAYALLLRANEINETVIANRFLGDILLQKRDKRALHYLNKVYGDYGTDPDYLNTFCYACIVFQDYQSAGKILQELKQLAPDHPNIPRYEKAIAGKQ